MKKPSISELSELFELQPGGRLVYVVSRRGWIRKGREAGSLSPNGYRYVGINGGSISTHLIVFALHHGRWSTLPVDHIDGNKINNDPANLREVTATENCQNLHRPRKDSRSGLMGVRRQCGSARGWMARITANKKRIHLGTFDTAEEAHAAYVQARRLYQQGNTL